MNDLTFNILKIVVSVVMALIAYYVIPYIKNRIKNDKYKELLEMIDVAVQAAEQSTKGKGMGALKKENVTIFIKSWIEQVGIKITDEQLDQLIEAAVFELNKGEKK
jgi:LL-H family phage holin